MSAAEGCDCSPSSTEHNEFSDFLRSSEAGHFHPRLQMHAATSVSASYMSGSIKPSGFVLCDYDCSTAGGSQPVQPLSTAHEDVQSQMPTHIAVGTQLSSGRPIARSAFAPCRVDNGSRLASVGPPSNSVFLGSFASDANASCTWQDSSLCLCSSCLSQKSFFEFTSHAVDTATEVRVHSFHSSAGVPTSTGSTEVATDLTVQRGCSLESQGV